MVSILDLEFKIFLPPHLLDIVCAPGYNDFNILVVLFDADLKYVKKFFKNAKKAINEKLMET